MQNGHGSGLSERMRNGNGNRGPSESEVVMVNGLRNAQKSPGLLNRNPAFGAGTAPRKSYEDRAEHSDAQEAGSLD